MKKNIITHLNERLPDINKIPDINSGGCGVFASILGDKLIRMGYKPRYFILTRTSCDKLTKTQANNLSYSEINERVPPTHVVIALKGYYIDSNGCTKNKNWACSDERLKKGMEMSLPQLKEYIRNESFWNTTFKRKHIPKIKRRIERIDNERTSIFNFLKIK